MVVKVLKPVIPYNIFSLMTTRNMVICSLEDSTFTAKLHEPSCAFLIHHRLGNSDISQEKKKRNPTKTRDIIAICFTCVGTNTGRPMLIYTLKQPGTRSPSFNADTRITRGSFRFFLARFYVTVNENGPK